MTTAVLNARSATGSSFAVPAVSRVFVFGQGAAGWRISQPVPVIVTRAGASYVVSDEIFSVYGEGRTWDEAQADYVASLVDHYLLMAEAADAATRGVVDHLRAYLHPDRA